MPVLAIVLVPLISITIAISLGLLCQYLSNRERISLGCYEEYSVEAWFKLPRKTRNAIRPHVKKVMLYGTFKDKSNLGKLFELYEVKPPLVSYNLSEIERRIPDEKERQRNV